MLLNEDSSANPREVYRHLWQTYGQNNIIRLSFLLEFLRIIGLAVLMPIFSAELINNLAKNDLHKSRLMLTGLVLTSFIGVVLRTVNNLMVHGHENRVYGELNKAYFRTVMESDVEYFHDNPTGYITTTIKHYTDNGLDLLREIRTTYMYTFLTVTLPIIVLLIYNRLVGLLMLLFVVLHLVSALWASKRVAGLRGSSRAAYKGTVGRMADFVTNFLAVKAAAQEDFAEQQLDQSLAKELEYYHTRRLKGAVLTAPRELITTVFYLAFFSVIIQQYSVGRVQLSLAVLIITYTLQTLLAIGKVPDLVSDHDDRIDRIYPAILKMKSKQVVRDPKKPQTWNKMQGAITFQKVDFAYTSNASKKVLSSFNLSIKPHEKIGIVGQSGAGKSTLAKLILRFYDVTDGLIAIDGLDVRKVAQRDLRSKIAYVPQEPLLLHQTIRENISFGSEHASNEVIESAARAAYADEFIEKLPEGMESIVGERGVKLSGGQKQRIAIARAFLQDAPIIIFDEATSALDTESEKIIQKSFLTNLEDRTVVVVAHRLSTIKDLDRIVVIEDGRIVEDGNHEELLALDGIYARLWKKQAKNKR